MLACCLLCNAFEREVFQKVARDLVCLFFTQDAEDTTRGSVRFQCQGWRRLLWDCNGSVEGTSTVRSQLQGGFSRGGYLLPPQRRLYPP